MALPVPARLLARQPKCREICTGYNNNESKKNQIIQMFDEISKTYDVLNTIITLGIDSVWRRKIYRIIKIKFWSKTYPFTLRNYLELLSDKSNINLFPQN